MAKKRGGHPLVRRLLQDYRQGRLAPLVGRCRECGDGYLAGDAWYATGQRAYERPIGRVACPWCGAWQGVWAPYQLCINGRCKRAFHFHLQSPAWQAAALFGQVGLS